MNIYKKEIFYPIICTISSIFFCTLMWDKISFNFSNPYEIIGEYSKKSYSVYNDTFRYLFFIIVPVLTFFITFLITKNNNTYNNFSVNIFKLKFDSTSNEISKKNLLFVIFVGLLLFLSTDWQPRAIQSFEDGMPLSGAVIFENNKVPWTDVYLNSGFFYDMLNAKISWLITGQKTIGSFLFYLDFLNFIAIILFIYFIYNISSQINFKTQRDNFFIFLSILTYIYLWNESIWRDIPLILFLIFSLNYLNTKSFSSIILLSFLSIFTFFWSLDRGFFVFLTYLTFLILVAINSKKDFLKFFLISGFFWIFTFIIIGTDVTKDFFLHTKEIFSQHEMLNGLIHPQPFSNDPDATRATRSLLIIILNFIFTIIIIFNKNDFFNKNTKFILLLFSVMNFIIYKSALSRSDGGHIKMASIFSITLLLIFLTIFLINYINQKKINLKFLNLSLILVLIILNINSLKNIPNFYNNLKNFISFENKAFINNNYLNSIDKVQKYFKNDNCLQAYTYDLAVYYIFDKPSCSKFFNIWVIGSKSNQLKYINEINDKEIEFILTGGKVGPDFLDFRYPYIASYLDKEYYIYKEFNDWKILKRKNSYNLTKFD